MYTITAIDGITKRGPQYFEMMGHRAIWCDGWKAVTFHDAGTPYENDTWGLFKLDEDFSEMHDLSSKYPEKLRELIDLWWAEADRNGVLPLDDRGFEIFGMKPRPGSPHARADYTYYPPISHIPSDASPMLSGRSWTIAAEVITGTQPVQGVIYSRGSHNIGHTFFIKDGVLNFDYNALSKHTRVTAPISLMAGNHEIKARFDRQDEGGILTLIVDGVEIGSGVVPKVMRMLGSMGMDIGSNQLSPVVNDYLPPFSFTGAISKVHFELRSKSTKADRDAVIRTESAKE